MSFRTPYPGYDVLAKRGTPSFDARTRDVVDVRLHAVPRRRFFTADEWTLLDAIVARLVPQPERAEPVPIAPWIDRQLAEGRDEGFRHPDMPPLAEAWRRGLAGIDHEAERRHARPFAKLSADLQDAVLAAIQRGDGDETAWRGLSPERFFGHVLLKTVVGVYYAHPLAWNEIGFGGPASPRGYVRLDPDRRDPWEAEETGRG